MISTVRSHKLLPFLGLALLFTAACAGSTGDNGGNSGGSILRVGTSAEAGTLDPQLRDDIGTKLATNSINEPLVDYDSEGELVPVLAAEMPEPLADGSGWSVSLQRDITFTNGEPFNAEAVKANLERMLSEEYGSALRSEIATISDVEVVDDWTVQINTDGYDALLPYRLPIVRMVAPAAAAEGDFGENPVGTGPYMLSEWNKGQSITLKANGDYWGDAPSIEEVELRFMPDVNTRLSALNNGEIDIAMKLSPEQAAAAPKVLKTDVGTEVSFVKFPLSTPPYDDVNFRRALVYAIDTQAIVDEIFNGQFEIAQCQPVVSTAGGFNADLQPQYEYDPDKARELLSQVDLPADFAIEFESSAGLWGQDQESSQAIASYWEAAGIPVNIYLREQDAYLDHFYQLDLGRPQFGESGQDLNHAARQVALMISDDALTNMREGQYPELGQLATVALTSQDEEKRQDAYDEIWQTTCEDALVWTGWERTDLLGVSDRVDYNPSNRAFEWMLFNQVTLSD